MLAVWIASLSVLMVIVIGVAYLVISSGDEDCKGGKVLKNKKCVCPDDFSWDEALSKCIADTAAATAATACTGGKVMVDGECTCVSPLVWNESLSKCAEAGLFYEKKDEFKSGNSLLHGPFTKPSNMRISFDVKVHTMVGHNTFLLFTTTAENPTLTGPKLPLIFFNSNNFLTVQNNTYSYRDLDTIDKEVWTSVIIDLNGTSIIMKIGNKTPTEEIGDGTSIDTSTDMCYLYNGITGTTGSFIPYDSNVTMRNLKLTDLSIV